MEGFVDVHSHVVPSGDDGARSLEEGAELCRLAHDAGTSVLFATPHAHASWDSHPLTAERQRLFEESFPAVAARAPGLCLRRGFEVFPTVLRDRDPHELKLEGTRAVLVEFPGSWLGLEDDSSLVFEAADRLAAAGLAAVVAHPERSLGVQADFGIAKALVERGCLLCPNGDSALGANGPPAERLCNQLVEAGLVALFASDGHRRQRPPSLVRAYSHLVRRYGEASVDRLFDGSALPWLPGERPENVTSALPDVVEPRSHAASGP